MNARVPCLGGNGHWCGREVLHLLELEIEVFGYHCQFCHVLSSASGVGTDEVRDELLAQFVATVYVIEDALEVMKQLEGRFAHEVKHTVGCVFGGNFEAAADMACYEFFGVFLVGAVGLLVASVVEQKVISHA